jgi:hypothetical protein
VYPILFDALIKFKTALYRPIAKMPRAVDERRVSWNGESQIMLRERATPWIATLVGSMCMLLTGCIGTVVHGAEMTSLVASPASVNLGSIPVGNATSATVSVANMGSAAVNVTQMSVTGNSFSVARQTAVPVSIPAGGTLSVNVNFVPSSAGQETGQLSINSDASTSPTQIALAGTGAAEAAAAATTPQLSGLSCTSASMGGTATDLCTATISGPAPAAGLRVALSSNNAAVTVSPAGLVNANLSSVQFKAYATPVASAQTATLTASAGGVTETFAIQLNVPAPALSLTSSSMTFASAGVNTPTTQSITLSSTGTAPVTISGATVSGAGFTLAAGTFPMTLTPGQTATVGVEFDPTAEGALTGQLTLTSNSTTNSTAVVSLSGTGLPVLTGLSCASASLGGTATDLCTATISGPAPAAGFRVALSSNNAAVTVSPAGLINANLSSVQFKAYATPVASAQTATLTASAGAVTETFAIQLNVPAPALSLTSSSMTFASAGVNTPTTQSITLSSTGTAPVTISGATVSGAGFTLAAGTFPMTLTPGQTAAVSVEFDPTSEGALTGQLTLTSNSTTNSTAVVSLSGTGLPVLTGLSCANASLGGTATDLCTATISGPAPAAGFRVALSSNNAAVTVSPAGLVNANLSSVQFMAYATPVTTAQTATLTASVGGVAETFALQLNVPAPALSLTSSSLTFASAGVNTPTTQSITLSSTGTAPLTISGATVSGAGFTLAAGTFPVTLTPGQTAAVSVEFDPAVEGPLTGQLTVTSNATTNGTAVVALSGTGLPVLTGLSCTSASMGGTATDLCTATISGPAPAAGFRVALSSNNAAVTVSPAGLVNANLSSVQFMAYATPVTSAQTATLTASVGGVSEAFAIQLTVPAPALSLNSSSMTFGSAGVNTPTTQSITLSSTGTAALTISGATVSGAGFTLAAGTFPVTLTPGQTATVGVEFDPTSEGALSGQLTITSNATTNGTAVVALSGTGLPVLTGISCTSPSVVGTTTDLCTATISGPAPAAGFRVALSSNNAAVTVSPAGLVNANLSSVQFMAYATPVATAQTVMLTASVGSATQTFALQLNATVPALGLSSASVVFGNVPVNVTATRTVTLTSTGAASLTINAASVSGALFSLTPVAFPIVLTPGQSTALSVQFDPTALGAAAGQLTIASNSTTNPTATVALIGTGSTPGSFSYNGSELQNTLVPPNPTTPISSNLFGMSIHHTSTPFPAFPVSTFRFWDAATWSTLETASGVYDWTHMDQAILIGNANGVSDYIFTFGSVPVWASTNPTDPCTGGDGLGSCDPPDAAALTEFATQTVQRYCGTVKYYEAWNEPNNAQYWDGTDAQLLAVAQQIYSIAKDPANCGCTDGVCRPNGGANPNQVLLAPISDINPTTLAWLDTYLGTTGAQYPYADVAAFHGYNETNPENIATDVQSLNQVLANHGLAGVQVWNTEASWGSTTAAVGEQQASWLMRYHAVQAVAGVSRFIWYAYDDCSWGTLWVGSWCANPQMPVGQVTQPGQAYPVVQSWLSGATLPSCLEYENGLWACELQRAGGYDAWMLWSSTGNPISVPIGAGSSLTIYRDWQNNVNALPSELMVDEMPVLLENQDL